MSVKERTILVIFFILSLMGVAFIMVELIMSLVNASLCSTEGCQIASKLTRFGTVSILVPGLAVFVVLAVLSARRTSQKRVRYDRTISIILNVALASEGFLTGYQIFRMHTLCAFCLAVFLLLAVLSVLWFIRGHRELAQGAASFVVIFSAFYLILPAVPPGCCDGPSPGDSTLTLFYDKSCTSCEDIEMICKACNININKLDAARHLDFFRFLNIDHLPVLVINEDGEKRIIEGRSGIEDYLFFLAAEKSSSG